LPIVNVTRLFSNVGLTFGTVPEILEVLGKTLANRSHADCACEWRPAPTYLIIPVGSQTPRTKPFTKLMTT
jgi:hypothetical protein